MMKFVVDHILEIVALGGGALLVAGLGMIYLPLAFICAGVLLMAGAVLGARP